jgi:hypothetical protein
LFAPGRQILPGLSLRTRQFVANRFLATQLKQTNESAARKTANHIIIIPRHLALHKLPPLVEEQPFDYWAIAYSPFQAQQFFMYP